MRASSRSMRVRDSRWFYLGIATLSQTALATIHLGIPTLIPLIQAELALNLTEVGMLVSSVNMGVVATVLWAGRAADRFGERLVIGYGTIAGGTMVLMVNFSESFVSLLPVFLLVGAPMATGTPAGSKAVAGWFPQKERGTAMGIRQTGVPVGGTIAALVLPSLGLAFGWRFALSATGLVTIAMGISVLLLYKEPEHLSVSRGSALIGGARDIIRRKDIWAVTLYAAIMAGCQWCYLSYIELYLTEDILLSLILAATLLAAGQISGAVGRIVFGLVSDRLFLGRRKPVMILLGIVGIAMAILMAFLRPETPAWFIFVVVCFLGLGTMSWQGLYLTLVSEIVGSRMAGVAVGMTNTVTFSGIVVLPPVFGFIADRSESYQMAWLAMAAVIVLPLVLLSRVKE